MNTVKCYSCRVDSGIVRNKGYTKTLATMGWEYRQNKYGVRCYCKKCVDAVFNNPAVVAAFEALRTPKRQAGDALPWEGKTGCRGFGSPDDCDSTYGCQHNAD